MKAYKVFYEEAINGAFTGYNVSEIVLAENDSLVEVALKNKVEHLVDMSVFKIDEFYELPLSRVYIKDLSVEELFKLVK